MVTAKLVKKSVKYFFPSAWCFRICFTGFVVKIFKPSIAKNIPPISLITN